MSDPQNLNPDELVAVFDNIDPILVSIVRDALASVDIESFIFDSNTSQIMNVDGRLLVPVRLMVYADTADEARECLRELGIEKS
jgi:Putative prokaryotic signal transducing protein